MKFLIKNAFLEPPPSQGSFGGSLALFPGFLFWLHSAAVSPISIPRSALCVKSWPPAANPCIFCGQGGCRCRPSAAVWPISIPRSALCGKNWPPAANPCIFCSKMASDCFWPLPSWTANFPNLAACQNLLVFKLNSLSKMPFWSLPPPRGLLEVPGPLSLGSSSGFSWLLLAVPGRS